MIDCIAGYHLNPWTCGIAKFNAILARRLELPVVGIGSVDLEGYRRPLLSLKMSEFTAADALALDTWIDQHVGQFELFLHAFDSTAMEKRMLTAAARVICGNRELAQDLRPARALLGLSKAALSDWNAAVPLLDPDPAHAAHAVEAIMTSDTRPKEIAVEFRLGGRRVRLGGICKGAGMIQPGMSATGARPAAVPAGLHATMLAFITTDAAVEARVLQAALEEAVAIMGQEMLGREFDEPTIDNITAFLHSLTGEMPDFEVPTLP